MANFQNQTRNQPVYFHVIPRFFCTLLMATTTMLANDQHIDMKARKGLILVCSSNTDRWGKLDYYYKPETIVEAEISIKATIVTFYQYGMESRGYNNEIIYAVSSTNEFHQYTNVMTTENINKYNKKGNLILHYDSGEPLDIDQGSRAEAIWQALIKESYRRKREKRGAID